MKFLSVLRIIIIITTLILLTLNSCKHECRVIKESYDNGQEKEVLIYPDCRDTTFYLSQDFYKSGIKSSEGHFRNGIKEGKFKTWSELGFQTADWEVIDGKENGFIKCWYDSGQKKKEVTLENGLESGLERTWMEDGKLQSEGHYISGQKSGTWKYYKQNGSLIIRNYENDILNGPTYEHNIDSIDVDIIIGQYQDGKETGTWMSFDKDSVLSNTVSYINGELTGDRYDFYKNGKIESKGQWLNGKGEGIFTRFTPDGKIAEERVYKNDSLISKQKY